MKILLLILICLYCASKKEPTSNKNSFNYEGWAGAPKSLDKKQYDYYYMIQMGNVKSRVKPEQMEKACIDSIRKNELEKITAKLVKDSLAGMTSPAGTYFQLDNISKFFLNEFKKRNLKVEILDCANTSTNLPWSECGCIVYIYVPGGREFIVAMSTLQ